MQVRTGCRVLVGAAALALVAAGCSDDEPTATAGGAGGGATTIAAAAGGDSEAYCALATELDTQEDFFTVEQLEALLAAAPEEIRAEAEAVVPVFTEAIEAGDPFAAFEDPVVAENLPAIEAYEEDTCGLSDEGDEEDEEVAIDPALSDYCGIAQEINDQEDFPSAEQLEEIRELAPEEIADEISTVVDAFLAAGDDPFAAFEDPAVEAAFGPIEAFDAENCGIESGGDEEDEEAEQDPSVTEVDPDAAQVAVSATDYAFAFDPAPAAGPTSFTMTNEGEERHVMLLFKLAEGATMDEVLESEGDEGIEGPEFESRTAAAGEDAVLTADLSPGDYGMICYIPNADGVPHLALGMVASFTVQ